MDQTFDTFLAGNAGVIFAGTVIAGIIPLILILPLQRYYVQGVSGTGIKG